MFTFRRNLPRVASPRRIVIEGLEGRQLLSGSIAPVSPSHGGPGPSIQMPLQAAPVQAPSSGIVVSVDLKTITLTASVKGTPTQVTLNVDPLATITADGAPVVLTALLPGASVQLTANSKNPAIVTSIRAVGSDVEGKVLAVNAVAGTVTITGDKGAASATFIVSSTAAITVNGLAGSLAGIALGAEVHLHLSPLDNSTAISMTAKNPDAKDILDVDSPVVGKTIEGAVAAIDLTGGTISVTTEHSVTPTVVAIPTTAKISIDGKPGTLAAIAVGSKVEIHLSATDPTIIVSVEVKSVV